MRPALDAMEITEKRARLFWSHATPNPETGCWEWQLQCLPNGYGKTRVNGKDMLAHRAAFVISGSSVPRDGFVLHSCDNRRCVNPEHLRVGTHLENMQDMTNRGRQHAGERHYNATLTADQVRDIRSRYIPGGTMTMRALGGEYGVSPATIHRVLNGDTWNSVA